MSAKYPAVINHDSNLPGLVGYLNYASTYGSLPAGQSHFTDTYRPQGPYEEQNPGKGIFMHLSFSSVGVDLHDGEFPSSYNPDPPGDNGSANNHFKSNLQWILSSGIHFQGQTQAPAGHNFSQFNANVTAVVL